VGLLVLFIREQLINGFFGANDNANISAIHWPKPITDIFKFHFLIHYQKYYVFYALPFFQKLQKSGFRS